jgi:hypothetical protein
MSKRVKVMGDSTNGVRMRVNGMEDLHAAIAALVSDEVLVGFPEDTTKRDEGAGDDKAITNAAIAYIHDQGAPEVNIPQREFMRPGVLNAQKQIERKLFTVAKQALKGGGREAVERGMHAVGLIAQAAIRSKINEGIPPPLSDRTLRDRARRGRTGAMWELAWREAGAPASTELAKPLIDTAQLRNAVNYVVRDRKKRKKD